MKSPHDANAMKDGWWVDRQIYTSEEILRQEKERIFYKTWHLACLTSEIENPGDYWSMSIVDQPILIVRGRDNELRAFFNACTHRGAVLNNHRCGNERLFKCMYHAWAFNLEGELVGVPYEEGYGPDFDKKKLGLVPVRVETFGSLVFVTINPEAPPLREYLGEIMPYIENFITDVDVIGRNSWTYEGNWKLWHENFRDNYHPQFAHRSINDAMPHYANTGGNYALAPGHSMLRWYLDPESYNTNSLARGLERYTELEFPAGPLAQLNRRRPNPGGPNAPIPPSHVFALFPNMDLQPNRGGAGFIQISTPISTDRARIDILMYCAKSASAEVRQNLLENMSDSQGSWGKVSADDTEAAVRCQIGLRGLGTQFSPFTRGPKPGTGGGTDEGFNTRDEYSLREFYRMYNQYMNGPAPLAVAAE